MQHALIVLRRRSGRNDEFVEDLRVRRPVVVALLRALTKRGSWRENRGEEPMHMYYTEFDWLSDAEIAEVLPEDGVPETLVIQDLDGVTEPTGLTRAVFQSWLHEGRHDCETAQAMLRFWSWGQRRGSDHDTEADFFDQLYAEYFEKLPVAARPPSEDADQELPVTHVAALIHIAGYSPFDTTGMAEDVVRTRLCEDILGEVAKVQAYLAAWKGSTLVAAPERQGVADEIEEVCTNAVRPWPAIEKTPVAMNEEGRFAKAFPLEFPMGVGDLRQPQLRGDFTATEWAQHKLRYFDGRFVASSRGHRVTWAIYDTVLLDHTRQRAHAYHTATESHVLTKRSLRELVASRDDLVREMATHGAAIPTTPMFWKRTTTQLEWCVRTMSWAVPWIGGDDGAPSAADVLECAAPASKASSAAVAPSRASAAPSDVSHGRRRVAAAEGDDDGEDDEDDVGGADESDAEADVDESDGAPPPCAPAETVWGATPTSAGRRDEYGLGRIPAFWFTLNCPYNYLHEIHRFHADAVSSGSTDDERRRLRTQWCFDHPDLVCLLHALRVELLVRMVMPCVVPTSEAQPFQYWVRFEEGQSGNPHAHGLCYAAGNPTLTGIESARRRGEAEMPEEDRRAEVANDLATYFSPLASEWHPAKDDGGCKLYDFHIENLGDVGLGRPQTIDLGAVLDEVLSAGEPDLTPLKRIVIALVEDGQRHTAHGHSATPVKGRHQCARQDPNKPGPSGVVCRYGFPKELVDTKTATDGATRLDPMRPGLYNLLLARNDPLINSFETHLLLANLGNIDWRPLINLWSVLEYLTKYTAKSGKSTRQLGTLFEDVLKDVERYEHEDGHVDLWRRTIQKFYNRVIGNRDYTLFEVVRYGIRLPPILSSFGDVHNASVSSWRALKPAKTLRFQGDDDAATTMNKMEMFSVRATLKRPRTIREDDLRNLSFYAFWRLYYYQGSSLHRRQRERMLSVTGAGYPKQAARTHAHHESYAQRTLYAYMPCDGLRGLDYVDGVWAQQFAKSWPTFLRRFVAAEENKWCPTWIRKNYDWENRRGEDDAASSPGDSEADGPDDAAPRTENDAVGAGERPKAARKPRAKYMFEEEDGEPPEDDAEQAATTLDLWKDTHRPPWQLHSELGPNLNPQGLASHLDAPWLGFTNPPDFDWCRRWPDVDVTALRQLMDDRKDSVLQYARPDLTKEGLGDDFQRLFVELVLAHVDEVLANLDKPGDVKPLRLLLLGTAGTGKTLAVQTLMQELQRLLGSRRYAGDFVQVAAPTGCAAFNIRFAASTLHRLFDMRNPRKWSEIAEHSASLRRFQEKMSATHLVVFDEISMVGKQMMGKISSRCRQAKTAEQNPRGDALGGLSCVGVGDPAQCPPISDEPFFDADLHKDTTKDPAAPRVVFSNQGKLIYESFEDVIILQYCHRVHRRSGEGLTAEDEAYNARGRRFLEVMGRLRDCEWTEADYWWLCERKLSKLPPTERAAFAEAPLIMEFRKDRGLADEDHDSCDAYNRRKLCALATEERPVAKFTACYTGVDSVEGGSFDDELFGGLPHTLELCEGAPVIYLHNLWVSAGLMNGTRGVVRAIVYRNGDRPDHTDVRRQLPAVVLVECPSYAGAAFFDTAVFPERRRWIPFFPREIRLETDGGVARSQMALTLAWALTPWKAQGMTLDKVVVNLGSAASKPGVAFVALTRARHYDGLALDDTFPDMHTFQKQRTQPTFKKRLEFERNAKARFSATIRRSMRDSAIYSETNVWSRADAEVAAALLQFVANAPNLTDKCVPEAYVRLAPAKEGKKVTADDAARVWHRLLTQFPHPFAVARARGTLKTFTPTSHSAAHVPTERPPPTHLSYDGWTVKCAELQDFVDAGRLSPSVLELFSQIVQAVRAPAEAAAEALPTIANAFYLTHPDKYRERLRSLVRKARCVLAPAPRKDGEGWMLCAISSEASAGGLETRCLVRHGNDLAASERLQFEAALRSTLPPCAVTYRRYTVDGEASHIVVLFEILATRLRSTPTKLNAILLNFVQCAHDAQEALVSFATKLLATTRERRVQSVAAAAAVDPDLRDLLRNAFGWPSIFDLDMPTAPPGQAQLSAPKVASGTAATAGPARKRFKKAGDDATSPAAQAAASSARNKAAVSAAAAQTRFEAAEAADGPLVQDSVETKPSDAPAAPEAPAAPSVDRSVFGSMLKRRRFDTRTPGSAASASSPSAKASADADPGRTRRFRSARSAAASSIGAALRTLRPSRAYGRELHGVPLHPPRTPRRPTRRHGAAHGGRARRRTRRPPQRDGQRRRLLRRISQRRRLQLPHRHHDAASQSDSAQSRRSTRTPARVPERRIQGDGGQLLRLPRALGGDPAKSSSARVFAARRPGPEPIPLRVRRPRLPGTR